MWCQKGWVFRSRSGDLYTVAGLESSSRFRSLFDWCALELGSNRMVLAQESDWWVDIFTIKVLALEAGPIGEK